MSGELVTVMNRTSRTIILSSPVGMKEETLRVGDNRIPLAVWEHSVACSPSLGRDPKLFVVPEARVERTSEAHSLKIEVDLGGADPAEVASAIKAAIAPAFVAPSIADMSAAEAKRVIEQTTNLDALDAWTSDSRKGVAAAAQKRIDALMGAE